MPQVPYSPVPQQALSGQGLPTLHPDVPAAAFGGDIATAISGMGKEIQGAGSEVFERAIWLQNLNNQAEAKAADANFMTAAGKLHVEYGALEGKNAVDAYPAYQEKLKALRHSIKDGLSTGASQRMFDSESLGTLSRGLINGASHAVSQQKAYAVEASNAERTATMESVAQNPRDEAGFNDGLEKVEGSVRQEAGWHGKPQQATDNAVVAYKSQMYATKYENWAKEAPFEAQKEFYANRDKMTEKDFSRVERRIEAQVHSVGSANIAQEIIRAHTDDEGNINAPMTQLQKEARDKAEKYSPGDAIFPHMVTRALDSEFNQRKYANKQERWDNIQTVDGLIQGGAGNMQQLLADPKGYAAYMALPKSEQLKVPARIDNYIKARDRSDNERTLTKLNGMKNNDVESFLNVDPTDPDLKLSQSQIRTVQGWQEGVKKQVNQDPRVDRAMGWMRGSAGAQMEALGVFRRTQRNKDDYDHLTGAVQSALDIWQENHKKPPTNKEFNEQIVPEVLKLHKEPGMFGIYGGPFGSDKPFFNQDISSKEYTKFVETTKADLIAKGGTEPTEQELYKAYTRMQLMKLYPPAKKTNE